MATLKDSINNLSIKAEEDLEFKRLLKEWEGRKAMLAGQILHANGGSSSSSSSSSVLIDVKPKQIVTSFTDQAPIHGWEPKHALREIWQNFRDGLRERFCSSSEKHNIVMNREGNAYFFATFGTEVVGSIDLRTPNKLIIYQSQCILGIEALQLASFKSDNKDKTQKTIGGHGEGFKVGINLLLRKGFKVTYKMPFESWMFSLKNAYTEKCKNMCVEIVPVSVFPSGTAMSSSSSSSSSTTTTTTTTSALPQVDGLVIEIEGPNAHSLFDPEVDCSLRKTSIWNAIAKAGEFTLVTKVIKVTMAGSIAEGCLSRMTRILNI